ncbi:MAG TPA: VOC family protein [Candidatus Binatia bacterium]|jgi:predicted 3-demethylubiquinone-9 3-methyltransferase (glyoxalase superfamily)
MQRITPCLWFDSNAEEAVNFYRSVFRDFKMGAVSRYGEAGKEIHGKPAGSVLTIEFELNGQRFTALNGGPLFKFNEAISFQVSCESQDEVDYYWEKLSEGGEPGQCGWLRDKYGVSWQIVPTILGELLRQKNPKKSENVMKALLKMKKLDVGALKRAQEEG